MSPRSRILLVVLLAASVLPLSGYVTLKTLRPAGIVQVKWPSGLNINYRINPAQGANVTGARTLTQVFTSSFGTWDALPSADISFVQGADVSAGTTYSGNSPDLINVLKTNLSPAEYQSVGGDALGVTISAFDDNGTIVDSDIVFNPGALFSTDTVTPATRIDLESVATHEIGHLLGLDHSSILSATMFPTIGEGLNYARALSPDEVAGIGSIYPNANFLTRGSISGTVRLTSNAVVYGALVVAVNASGQPVASSITDPSGKYFIGGLPAGSYSVYAEPMDQPFTINNVGLNSIYPGRTPNTSFTTRFK